MTSGGSVRGSYRNSRASGQPLKLNTAVSSNIALRQHEHEPDSPIMPLDGSPRHGGQNRLGPMQGYNQSYNPPNVRPLVSSDLAQQPLSLNTIGNNRSTPKSPNKKGKINISVG